MCAWNGKKKNDQLIICEKWENIFTIKVEKNVNFQSNFLVLN